MAIAGDQGPAQSHIEFFERIDWFARQDCERLPEELRWARAECPVVHTAFDGGSYIVTKYDDLRTVAENPDVFSSAMPGVLTVPVPLPPLDLDPPIHRDFRTVLNRFFSRSYLLRYRAAIEALADELIDGFIERGQVEFVREYAIPFTSGSLALVVLSDDNEERLKLAIDATTQISEGNFEANHTVAGIAAEILAERVSAPDDRDDVLQALTVATVDGGRPLTESEKLGVVTVLLQGGLDTTRGAIAHIGRFLATDPEVERRLLRADWIKGDLDEFLRITSTVSVMGRVVTQETELLGRPMKAGDRLSVHWQSGNRDESKFDRADEIVFDRPKNPHVAFGLGIHRCLGQHFARLQLEIAFDRLVSRLANFSIVENTVVKETVGITPLAPEEMYIRFDGRERL